jgi:multiple sugar transport system ATP-binding protein
VTHDQVEALSLGDRIAVMKDGEIVQCDTPSRIYDDPTSVFVGSFIGSPAMNFVDGALRRDGGGAAVEVRGARIPLARAPQTGDGVGVVVGIRPEHIAVRSAPAPDAVRARVVVLEPIGPQKLLTVRAGEATLKVTTSVEFHADPGAEVWLRFEPARIRLMDARTGDALGG